MGLERSPPPKTHTIMGLKQVLPLLALAAACHGAALPDAENFDMETVMDLVQEFIANPDPYMEAFGVRAKRHVEDLNRSGFKQFPIPFLGAEVGIKYKDPSNRVKGGEAYVDIKDLASMVSRAKSRAVQIHAKFDGGHSQSDGLFTMDVDYHFEHKDGSGTEEGSMMIKREKKGGMWHTEIKTEFTLTDKRFTTTQTLSNGESLTTTITWKNRWDSPNFLLDNKVHVNLDGTERKLDLNMDWGMSKVPDMNLT